MTSKIRIKFGHIEVDFEGEEAFLKEELPKLVSAISQLHKEAPVEAARGADATTSLPESPPLALEESNAINAGMNSIAAKLGATSGPSIITAAAAYLTFVKRQEEFSDKELRDAMKEATSYFTVNHGKNFKQNLKALIDQQKINQRANSKFALPHTERKQLEAKLANS